MTDEPKFRYAGVIDSGHRDPRHILDVPKSMTLSQFMKVNRVHWFVKLWINNLIAYSKVVGRLTRPFR